MTCCGSQRGAIAANFGGTPDGMHAAAATVAIRYFGTPEVTVRGAATGQHYRFSPEAPVQKVSLRDSELLLRSRLFKRV
jgi:hypothetical protein